MISKKTALERDYDKIKKIFFLTWFVIFHFLKVNSDG
jgi:hypothetical protein